MTDLKPALLRQVLTKDIESEIEWKIRCKAEGWMYKPSLTFHWWRTTHAEFFNANVNACHATAWHQTIDAMNARAIESTRAIVKFIEHIPHPADTKAWRHKAVEISHEDVPKPIRGFSDDEPVPPCPLSIKAITTAPKVEERHRDMLLAFPLISRAFGQAMRHQAPFGHDGISVGDGWLPFLEALFRWMEGRASALKELGIDDEYIPILRQVKEKFGTLRCYGGGVTAELMAEWRERVEAAGKLSSEICESCGEPGILRNDGGWCRVRCDRCRK